jgi:type 1 glutamine amidotransferase
VGRKSFSNLIKQDQTRKVRLMHKPFFAWTLAAVLLVGASFVTAAPKAEDIEKIKKALPEKAAAKPKKARKLLIYTKTNGFRHRAAIDIGPTSMKMLGEKTGAFTIVHTEDPSYFEPAKLKQFDAVLFLNTTGECLKASKKDKGDEEALKKSLVEYVKNGGGIAGFHSATDTYKKWKDYNDMMGGAFAGHPWGGGSRVWVKIDDPNHALTPNFKGASFEIQDEIYQFREDTGLRTNQRILLSLDGSKMDLKRGKRKNGDYPVAWVRSYGKGRCFYSSLGHNAHIYWDARILPFYLAGLQYALGDLDVETTPVPLKK